MTVPAAPITRQAASRSPLIALVGVAAVAWVGVIAYALDMGNEPGTMGLGLAGFLPMWGLMMTAMMLPAVSPVALMYLRTITGHRAWRVAAFVAGYLVVWTAVGVPAYLVLRQVDDHADDTDTLRVVAIVILAVAGTYQLTPLKSVCLRHCRSPLSQLLRYANVKGRSRDLQVALHHASFCVGCCWALMLLLVAFGVMNVWFMLALAALVLAEKVWRHGEALARVAGIAFLVLAGSMVLSATVADAILPAGPSSPMSTM